MIKKIINYIFIYILLILFVSCDDNDILSSSETCTNCYLEMDIPSLDIDSNGYYHLDFNDNTLQTYVRLEAYVGYEYEYVGWGTDTYFEGCTWNQCESIPIVNGVSYSDDEGMVYTMLGVYEGNIADTAKVWCGYYDDYGVQHLDSLEVIIDE